ncbi:MULTISPECIES: S10 family peptidase [Sphingomonas]|uniref:Peptidase S10 n=1 Tax=Sphingomonas molluscorum TaxID=418184 RepID=A0ABU8Q628_9SPHN|nr:peptidase S10 [Sphingomonas sp. JUb134]MBM7406333.1 carboxypeptidase C (cathepsin A) [Sphingomonas sp. JUb134]
MSIGVRFLVALLLCSSAAATAQGAAEPKVERGRAGAEDHKDKMKEQAEAGWAIPPVEEQEARSKGRVTVGGRSLGYTATAGTLTVRDIEGKPTASMFYTAYTLDGTKPGTRRPITFFYNGGPGSPTFWLHMGSFAPVRLKTTNPEFIKPAPYDFGPNGETLLDKTDMVFLDAIGAGYSRPLGDAKPEAFYGVDEDADVFAKAILRYVTKNGRWNSPKFLFGESYGTLRSGALAYQLQDRGMALNGVVLLSSIMNYGYRQPGLDQLYLNYLPSFAATAWYHRKLPNPPADVATAVAQARAFAVGPYAAALAKGQTISPAEEDAIAEQMSQLIGLSPAFIKQANLRVDLARFQKELLRDRRQTIGRFDSRYTGIDPDAAGERPETDASSDAISGAFIATFHDYVTHTLGYKTEMPYRLSAREAAGWTWNWQHKAPGRGFGAQNNPNTALDLGAAMRANPYLKVLSLNGYYDMATPFFGTENDLGHMMLERSQQGNLSFRYYPAGHMTYVNPEALHQMKVDLAGWYDEAVEAASSPVPPQAPSLSAGEPGQGPN